MEKPRHHHSVFWPILLISAGIIFLLSNIGVLGSGIGELFSTYWPLIFVAAGLDGIFRREGWVGAILLIGLGTVLILANLGYLAWDSLKILLKLWPIFLIAWGFDLIFKGRPAWASIFGVLLAVILVGGILWLGFTQTGRVTGSPMTIEEILPDGAKQADINLDIPAGSVSIGAGSEGGLLASGDIMLPKGLSLVPKSESSGSLVTFTLKTEGSTMVPFVSPGLEPDWNLKLNSILPMDLNINLAAGEQMLDLRGTHVQELDINTAVGRSIIILPDQKLTGVIKGAVGVITIKVPKDAAVLIKNEGGLSPSFLPAGYIRSGQQIVSPTLGSGKPTITLTVGQAVGFIRIVTLP